MAWYSTGTVSVTNGSATVTGAATAWFGALQSGWGFVGPDGRAYEIANVASDTSLTLAKGYLGATASGQSYSCWPTMSLAADLASAFQGLIGQFQGIIDNAGAGRFAAGSLSAPSLRAIADPDTGLNLPGGNVLDLVAGGASKFKIAGSVATGDAVQANAADATAGRLLKVGAFGLGGLAPILTGSLDATDNARPPGRYAFDAATVTGTPPTSTGWYHLEHGRRHVSGGEYQLAVYESGTQPRLYLRTRVTGAWAAWTQIDPERGSNANGEYTRFADGTQICWHRPTAAYSSGSTINASWTFPAAFTDATKIVVTGSIYNSTLSVTPAPDELLGVHFSSVAASSCSAQVRRVKGGTSFVSGDTTQLFVQAVGRWF